MRISADLRSQMISDLGINLPFVKGQKIAVRKCWHFYSDGQTVDYLFTCREDFLYAMNLLYVLSNTFPGVVILAFCLMDTHIHFGLYGDFEQCNKFTHEFVRRLSMYIAQKYDEHNKLEKVDIKYQVVGDDFYLKTVICYIIKNAPQGGLQYNAWDYPWSSGPLYFRTSGNWCSPPMTEILSYDTNNPGRWTIRRNQLKTRGNNSFLNNVPEDVLMFDGLVFPGEYVAYDIVEQIFKSHKALNYFMCISKEEDVESQGGATSFLTIPLQELRQHKTDLCHKLFGVSNIKFLDTNKRLKLARALKSQYNCSLKQIARVCGLKYDEIVPLFPTTQPTRNSPSCGTITRDTSRVGKAGR